MVKDQSSDTEQKILSAARKIFIEKGRDGARMQEIADEAGINKSLLHYYFRSKDKLFQAIFLEAFKRFAPNIKSILVGNTSFPEKLDLVVATYFELLNANPYLPLFILNEISRNPESMQNTILQSGIDASVAQAIIESASKEGYYFEVDPRHYFISLLGMTVMPFLGRSLFEKVLFGEDKESYDRFLLERKTIVSKSLLKLMNKR